MTVRLNEAAISAFFRNPDGPVALDIERRAFEVTKLAVAYAARITPEYPVEEIIGYRIEQGPESIQAVVGIIDVGRVPDYLSEKEERERVWLVPALRDGFDA